MKKVKWYYQIRLFVNRLIYGIPTLCARHSAEPHSARTVLLDSFNCEKCTPAQIVLSKRDAEIFSEALLNPPKPNKRLKKAMRDYKRKYER